MPSVKKSIHVVVGSAPGATQQLQQLYNTLDDKHVSYNVANGGLAIALSVGVSVERLFTTCYLFRYDSLTHERETVSRMSNCRPCTVREICLDCQVGHPNDVLRWLSGVQLSFYSLLQFTRQHRDKCITRILGEPLRVSTGIWAICHLLTTGAKDVIVVGVNVDVNGHDRSNIPSKRDHVLEDGLAVRTLADKYNVRFL